MFNELKMNVNWFCRLYSGDFSENAQLDSER